MVLIESVQNSGDKEEADFYDQWSSSVHLCVQTFLGFILLFKIKILLAKFNPI